MLTGGGREEGGRERERPEGGREGEGERRERGREKGRGGGEDTVRLTHASVSKHRNTHTQLNQREG